MKALSQTTLMELALAGAVRDYYSLYGRADGYVLSVQCRLSEVVLAAMRGGPRHFARIENAFTLLPDLRVAVVEVCLGPAPEAPRPTAAAVQRP